MNCAEGQLAVITRSSVSSNLGALVEVLRPWGKRPGWWWVRAVGGPRPGNDGNLRQFATVADTALRPVQPGLPFSEPRTPARAG